MSLVYSETHVKKKPLFSSGDPEPQLREGELFIYLSKDGEHFVVQHEKTPVSNAFIKKNDINYRIRMASGPFSYEHSNEYITADHRKYFRVAITLKLEVVDAVRLYNAKVSDIKSYLDGIIPSFIAGVVLNYEIDEIIELQRKLKDVEVFPGLLNSLQAIGLRVATYTSLVQKDTLQSELDKDYRKTEHDIGLDIMSKTAYKKSEHELNTMDAVEKAKSKIAILHAYDQILLEGGISPDILIDTVEPEHKELLRAHWIKKGTLLEKPQDSEIGSMMDEMLEDINIK